MAHSIRPVAPPPILSFLSSPTNQRIDERVRARGLDCPHLRLLVVALGDLVVGDVHQPDLGLLVPGLAAEDLDKAGGNVSVWEEETEEV